MRWRERAASYWQLSRRKSYEEAVADVDGRIACRRCCAGVCPRRVEFGELVFAADGTACEKAEAQESEERRVRAGRRAAGRKPVVRHPGAPARRSRALQKTKPALHSMLGGLRYKTADAAGKADAADSAQRICCAPQSPRLKSPRRYRRSLSAPPAAYRETDRHVVRVRSGFRAGRAPLRLHGSGRRARRAPSYR
jgi:hypothetical protein